MKTRLLATAALALLISGADFAQAAETSGPVYVSDPVVPVLTPALRDLPQYKEDPSLFNWQPKKRDDRGIIVPDIDMPPHDNPLAEIQMRSISRNEAFGTPIANFAGVTSTCCPPDDTGDVGPSHFLQGDNGSGGSRLTIYNKSGTQLGQYLMETLGSSPCNNGYCDPIIQYDELANRWLITEFDSSANVLCIYVSRTSDPLGQWWAYSFDMTSQGGMQDYPKYAVWPDGYYVGVNNGGYIHVLERPAMLTGSPATSQTLTIPTLSGFSFQLALPATVEGDPPPSGAPAIFARPVDTEIHTGYSCSPTPCDVMDLWAFHVDWATPANTTVTHLPAVRMAEFDHTLCGTGSTWNCLPQPGTTQKIDPIREPLHFPLQYRNWSSHETLVGAFAEDVDGTDHAAVHWFEMRKVSGTWSMYQEGVLGGESGVHRSVAGAAMDGSGNIAVGYTRTGSSSPYYPSIYYSGRLATDTLGTMPYYDNLLYNATTSQSGTERWGDYAGIGVDPTDDCTFWFTTEYGGSQQTRIAAFKFDQCGCLAIPAAPVASASAPQANRIAVNWNDSATATITRYWVYRSLTTGGPYSQIAEVADTSPGVGGGANYIYNDDTVSGGTRYYYIVKSNDGAACTSLASNEVNALATGICMLPPTFSGLSSVTNPGNATCTLDLVWIAGTSNCSGTLTYNIYRDTTPGFTPAAGNRIATGLTGTSYSDSGTLVSGTTYYYEVHAVDSVNSLEDGNVVEKSGTPMGPVTSGTLTDTFEGALSGGGFDLAGWTHSILSGSTNWAWSTAQAQTPTHSWFAADLGSLGDKVLLTPEFGVLSNTTLTFYHRYTFEGTSTCFDGGTMEYATSPYTTWTVIPDAYFAANGFNGTVSTSYSNPIGGKRAYCFSLTSWTQVTINLGPLASQTIKVRWHEGDDSGVAGTGWYVDTVVIADAGTAGTCTTGGGCSAPGAPTLNSATGTCAAVNLSWTAGSGTTNSYNVYRSSNTVCPVGTLTKLNASPLTATTYSDTTAVGGTIYTYVVRGACDAGGATESVNSNCLTGMRLGVAGAPTGVTASSNRCTDIQVAWNSVTGATSYNVLRGTVCGTVVDTFAGVTSPYNDTTAVAGVSYQYWVVAVHACGNSANSSCATGSRLAIPAAPTGVTATNTRCTDVRVTWSSVTGASSYNVLRGTTCGTVLNTFSGVTSPYNDTTAVAGTTYNYWVVAVNTCGTSPDSACASGVRLGVTAAPAGVTATNNRCTDVQVAWGSVTGASSYNVLRGTACGTVLNTFTGVTSPYSDTSAVAGTTYNYWVVAINACGTSANSSCAAGTRLVSPTPTITGASSNACPATTVELTTESGKSNYQWYAGGSPIGGANADQYAATATGSYTVSYTDTNGCSGTSSAKAVTIAACAPNIVYSANGPWTQVAGMSNDDAVLDPGESWDVVVTLANSGNAAATNVVASLTAAGATFCTGTAGYGSIGVGGTAPGTFRLTLDQGFTCGNILSFNVVSKASSEGTYADQNGAFAKQAGTAGGGIPTNYPQTTGLPLSIPDNDSNGITSSLTITDAGTISDVNVNLGVNHTWVGDLVFTLTHVETGTTVTLIDRPGVPASSVGCSRNNIAATLDDSAASPVENQCASSTPTISGTFSPNSPLSAFNGENLSGTWRLKAFDLASTDIGTITSWSLDITPAGSVCTTWTGTTCIGAPLRVPYSLTPTRVVKNDADGTDITVTWDAANCPSSDYHIVWGYGAHVTTLAGSTPTISGGKCDLGSSGTLPNWNSGVPDPASDPGDGKFVWFLVVGDNNGSTEGSWGLTTAGGERGLTTASGQCACTSKNPAGGCGTD